MSEGPRYKFQRRGSVFIRRIGRHDIWSMRPGATSAWVVWADDTNDYCDDVVGLEHGTLTAEEFEVFRALYVLIHDMQPAEIKKKKRA
jgi:hypothetical protein